MKKLIVFATILILHGVNPVSSFPLIEPQNRGKVVKVGNAYEDRQRQRENAREHERWNERRREEIQTEQYRQRRLQQEERRYRDRGY